MKQKKSLIFIDIRLEVKKNWPAANTDGCVNKLVTVFRGLHLRSHPIKTAG
jgi:hypothetical protein